MRSSKRFGFLVKLEKDRLKKEFPEVEYKKAMKDIEEFFYDKWFNVCHGNLFLECTVTETDSESYYLTKCINIAQELCSTYPWVKECCSTFELLEIDKSIELRLIV